MTVVEEIQVERDRQKDYEGYSEDHDDDHIYGELAQAASCYADPNPIMKKPVYGDYISKMAPVRWPWETSFWKPKNSRSDLIRAAALIVAEIERLDRMPPL